MEATRAVEFVTEESRERDTVAAIEENGGTIEREPAPWEPPADLLDDYADLQFEPLTIIAAVVSAGFLIKRISDVWLDHARPGGQVIDTRGDKIVIRVAPYLKRGTLVLQSNDELHVYSPEDKDEALPVLEKFIARG